MTAARERIGDSGLAAKLRRAVAGDVLFSAADRGRYSTDASIYQIEPIGVVVPRNADDVLAALTIAREEGVPVLPRGGGTSQCGQTVGTALVIDCSKHMRDLLHLDVGKRTAVVQPGLVLDALNKTLAPHGLFFPVDVSTASRATIGGMAGNNSCGARSIRYGNMVHNVRAIDAVLTDGTQAWFGDLAHNRGERDPRYEALMERMRQLGQQEASEIAARFPKLLRRVGGYNLDMMPPQGSNMAHLLVGSEGTLAFFQSIELDLQPIPPNRMLGVCHFQTFRSAMEATRHIVALGPSAVELVDATLIGLARENPVFRPVVERFVRGAPDALLLVEFAGEDAAMQLRALDDLEVVMGELGHAGGVVRAEDPKMQREIWEVRKAALNIVMSMKGDGKPVSFVEDCAVSLEDLPDYTARLSEIFAKHGTSGTWYAHASVGTLHVRPILNLKQERDVKAMRAIAEEAFAMVREYKGSHSGEHGDGIVRSEFHEVMFGRRVVGALETVKDSFDPDGLLNPGKIVRPYRMDDRALLRYPPGYSASVTDTALDWSDWGGFAGAVEMCNNNGACRKADPGVMCPSYRVTGDERHVTRGRANTLRLAISGQLGAAGLGDDAVREAMDLCVGCKGCKRECPTGVDMARMKTEFLHHYHQRHRRSLRDRAIAHLPRYAPWASRVGPLLNLRDRLPGLPALSQALLGVSAKRSLPRWHGRPFQTADAGGDDHGRDVVLFVDTFNHWYEPENARAAVRVLAAAGYRVRVATPAKERPLCCGRTFLAAGMISEAREEAARTLAALRPFVDAGVPIVGLEPACLLTLRDEFPVLLPGPETRALAERALLIEEWLCQEAQAGLLSLPLGPVPWTDVRLHGHCHQKAFGVMPALEGVLDLIPGLDVATIASSCCGMAGSFGYEAEHYETSLAMAELSLLPAVRAAGEDTAIVAGGTSCRQQIRHGTGRAALHPVRLLKIAVDRAVADQGLASPEGIHATDG